MSTVFDCMFSVLGKIMGQVLQTILGVFLVDFGFCRGIGKTVLKRFRSVIGSNKLVNVLLGARFITMTHMYGVRARKNHVGMEWSWDYQCKCTFSITHVYVCDACNMCMCIHACVHIGICLPMWVCRYSLLYSLKRPRSKDTLVTMILDSNSVPH